MKIENGKIKEATETEIYSYWLTSGWWEFRDFNDYVRVLKSTGVIITESEVKDNGHPHE